ncbi:CaiB/BaiF CoA transferase family protein [Bosea vaviloviae]|uniref:CaiB/BaiF CoA transferase family protein n=1 Tax=Bosea vaviloviae TaxID=1526658 RepID=UPI0018CFFB69|nr:CoA transferase [Bosea vaviloviae]
MTKPLTGVRVLDLTKVLAGPLCTQYLGEMGAEIIKVEPVQLGDETRGWPPFRAPGLGAVYMSVNRNKRSIALDLKTERGKAIVHRLAKTADVAIESFGTGVAERLGIDAETLRAINPRLIHCSISGFGREGPLRAAPGYDVILQAFCGVMALTGEEGGSYIRSPISPIDQMTGMHALTGILAKLYERQNGGAGGTVNVSLYDTAMGLMAYNLQSFWERGVQPKKCGSSHESLCPYQALEAADGPIMIGVANDNLWRKFCAAAGLDQLADDPEFRTNADRVRNRARTLEIVQAALLTNTAAHWYEVLSKAGIPCSPINSIQQLLDHPHTQATGMVMTYDRPGVGDLHGIAQPVRFDGRVAEPGLSPPNHGEHTEEILAELGLTPGELESLAPGEAAA